MTTLFKTPKAPTLAAPTPMPTPDTPEVDNARRRQVAAAQQRTGRMSTILSDMGGSEKLGG